MALMAMSAQYGCFVMACMTIMQQLCIVTVTPRHIMLSCSTEELLYVSHVSTDAECVTTLAMTTACVIALQDCNISCDNGAKQTGL